MRENPLENADGVAARCAAIFAANDLGAPRSLAELVDHVSRLTGRPVLVESLGDKRWENITALWFNLPDADLVMVRSTDSELYRTHCTLHELAHIICRHPGCSDLASIDAVRSLVGGGYSVRGRTLTPKEAQIAPEGARFEDEAESLARMLGRSLLRPRYAADEEAWG